MQFNPDIIRCVNRLRRGDAIAYPTEAVWGLGCDPFNLKAVAKVLRFKQRAVEKGLILIAGEVSQLEFLLAQLPEEQRERLLASWPGHNTWLIPHYGQVPDFVSGYRETVAVRVSTHTVVRALCAGFGGPIVSTSANPQRLAPARSRLAVRKYFGADALTLAPGHVGGSEAPSTIRDLRTGKTIRA